MIFTVKKRKRKKKKYVQILYCSKKHKKNADIEKYDITEKKKFRTLFRHQTLHLCSGFIGDPLGQWNASENDLELIAIPFGLKIKRKSYYT